MKQNRSTLYLILACLFALALPLFDYLEYIQFRQAQLTYQYGYLQLAIRPLILPMCSLLLGWFLVHFLGIQKTNLKIFFSASCNLNHLYNLYFTMVFNSYFAIDSSMASLHRLSCDNFFSNWFSTSYICYNGYGFSLYSLEESILNKLDITV